MARSSEGFFFLCITLLASSSCLAFFVRQADDSCVGKCEQGLIPNAPCQCNAACTTHNDCCSDYTDVCLSCKDRCGINYDEKLECQCNSQCPQYGNCCQDYDDVCDGVASTTARTTTEGGGGTVTDQDLEALSEELILLDENNMGAEVDIDVQGETTQCSNNDVAPNNLFVAVNEANVFGRPTFALLRALFDNYEPYVTEKEDHTEGEHDEELAFLDAVIATQVMRRTREFLVEKGVFNGDESAFKQKLYDMWFGMYDRDGTSATVVGSSGFEHVFIGEKKEGDVSGFHGWVHFYEEEKAGRINYVGWLEQADFGGYGYGVSDVFTWGSEQKCFGSMFVGTSPELDLALYTTCFLTRPDAKCKLAIRGAPVFIQTYTLNYNGNVYVGTAYPDWS